MLDEYGITRDDFVSVMGGLLDQKGEWNGLSKAKSNLTRMYNKTAHHGANQFADDNSLFKKVDKTSKRQKSHSLSQTQSQTQTQTLSYPDFSGDENAFLEICSLCFILL